MAPKFPMSAKDFSFLLMPPLSHGKFYGTQRGTAVSIVSTCEIEQASKCLQHQNKLQLASTELLVKKVLSIAK